MLSYNHSEYIMLGIAALKEIGAQGAKRRRDKGWTQAEMAARTNVNRSTISTIENGSFTGSLKIMIAYLTALGLQLSAKTGRLPVFGEDNGEEEDE